MDLVECNSRVSHYLLSKSTAKKSKELGFKKKSSSKGEGKQKGKAKVDAKAPKKVNKKEQGNKNEQGKKKEQGKKNATKDAVVLKRGNVNPTVPVVADEEIRKQQFYLTTAINYTNGPPHVGHAYEAVTSDVISRYHRMFGRDVFFLTGSDEHGQKVEQSAISQNLTPMEVATKYTDGFKALNKKLNISNDFYIRTTMPHHGDLARKFWERVKANGDIYLKDYVGWYNVHEEQYVTDKEAEACGYKDEHGRKFEKKSEESYFFRMSKYQDRLIKLIKEDNPRFIQPASCKKEILRFIEGEPLHDLCISRTVCQWGVACPEDPEYKGTKNHVMYVWFDALNNYLSGVNYLGDKDKENRSRYWPANVHVIGKDIIRFHCVYWPTMLMSAGIPLPKCVFGHGFVVAEDGVKMSKSIGNVVDPQKIVKTYPLDSLRFYIARGATYGNDMPFSEKAMCAVVNAALNDGLGNLLHRVTSLCQSYCDGKIPSEQPLLVDNDPLFDLDQLRAIFEMSFSADPGHVELAAGTKSSYQVDLEQLRRGEGFQLQVAADAAIEAVNSINRYLQTQEPWKLKGQDEATAAKKRGIVRAALEGVYAVAHFLQPFVPGAMEKLFHKLGVFPTKIACLKSTFNILPPGTTVYVGPVLFDRIAAGVGVVSTTDVKAKTGKADYEKAAAEKKAKKAAIIAANKKKQTTDDPNQPEFTKVDVRVGKIVKVWKHESAERLFCEEIDVGEEKPRQIASGLREHYKQEDLENRLVLVVCNLKARKLAGFASHGMVLCATGTDKVEFVDPPAGSKIGERVGLEGCDPNEYTPEEPNKIAKKKIFDSVAKKLATNGESIACWDGKAICSSVGNCKAASLTNVPIH
mmetsp:Transcript_35871/g.57192  ORF Transcript_35871/g.57192 Transcript_35871/m.57192 type:complete len:861 (+) Transcript_35871:164-2746(+)